jgi:hypothetical protein
VKPLESSIERAVVHRAQMELGVESIKLVKRKGLPDRLFLVPGWPLLIEFKRKDAKPNAFQLLTHRRFGSYGYDVQVHDTVEGALAAVEDAVVRGKAHRETTRSRQARG